MIHTRATSFPLVRLTSSNTWTSLTFPIIGSIVYGNAWAILHDEATYPDAETYNPERFIGDNPQPNPTTLGVFGFGRRICPGRHLAMNSTYIAVAALLWAFDIFPDEKEVADVNAYTDGAVS